MNEHEQRDESAAVRTLRGYVSDAELRGAKRRLEDLVKAEADRGEGDYVEVPLSEASLLDLACDPNRTVRLDDEQAAAAREIEKRSREGGDLDG